MSNRWSSESHQARLNGRVAIEVGEANVSIFGEAMGQNILPPNFENEFKRCF